MLSGTIWTRSHQPRQPSTGHFTRFRGSRSQYAAVVSETGGEPETLAGIIGPEAYRQWSEFHRRQAPAPHANQLPALFLKWAMMHFPAVASAGASALARAVLETAAPPGAPREYGGTYQELRETLRASAAAKISFQTVAQPGSTPTGVHGLWAGALPDSQVSRLFAASAVACEVRFSGVAVWPSRPGPWYRAEALRAAFANPASPPWPAAPQPVWESFFGPGGSMARAVAALVVVDGIDATIDSAADFTAEEQAEVESHAQEGFWPFYAPASETVTIAVTFGGSGGMRIRTVTQPGNPAAIGANVVSMARYLCQVS